MGDAYDSSAPGDGLYEPKPPAQTVPAVAGLSILLLHFPFDRERNCEADGEERGKRSCPEQRVCGGNDGAGLPPEKCMQQISAPCGGIHQKNDNEKDSKSPDISALCPYTAQKLAELINDIHNELFHRRVPFCGVLAALRLLYCV